MKRIECEMCGSTDLVKKDGFFECQSCGLKYSVEEIRKMMIEGTVDVSGSTVKVDKTDSLRNILVLAKRAKKEGNTEEAKKYYNMALMEDPENWEASFYSSYYNLLESSIGKLKENLNYFVGRANTTLELILNDDANISQQLPEYVDSVIELYVMISNHIINRRNEIKEKAMNDILENALRQLAFGQTTNAYVKYQEETMQDNSMQSFKKSRLELNQCMGCMRGSLAQIYNELRHRADDETCKKQVNKIIECWDALFLIDTEELVEMEANYYIEYFESLTAFDEMVAINYPEFKCEALNALLNKANDILKTAQENNSTLAPSAEYVLNWFDAKAVAEKKESFDAYWSEHAEEKIALETEKKELEAQLLILRKKEDNLKKDLGITDLMNQISELHKRKDGLGLFKGKEKKEIQAQIDRIERELAPKNKQLKDEEYSIKSERNNLTRRLEKINDELTKDR